jgi:tRNA threonylcarbamoyladenosine biosynthesis protein TsaE
LRLRSRSPDETRRLAAALARAFDHGGVVALVGPLGAGKTVFAKGLAEGLGLDPSRVSSPSFVIASEYPLPGAGPLRRWVHVDLFRVRSADELEVAGLADWLEPGSLVAVEWGDRFPEALPADRLEVRIGGGDAERELEVRALGPEAERVRARWCEELGAC